MITNHHHTAFPLSVFFITAFIFIACHTTPENKTGQPTKNTSSMDKAMPDMNMDKPKMAMDTNKPLSDNLKFAIKPTNEYVRSGVPLTTLQTSKEEIEIAALGRVAYDSRQIGSISSRISGRIEKLYVRYRFQKITAGQKIMEVYSPEIVTAEENFLFLLKSDSLNTSMIHAAQQKLLLLGMSETQLNNITNSQKPDFTIAIYSKYSGHIHEAASMENNTQPEAGSMGGASLTTEELSLKEGMYVQKGQAILSVFDPNHAWIILNFYSDNQALIHVGSPVRIVPETSPDKMFSARIDFMEPFYRKEDKTVAARVYFDNSHLQIPIGSQVSATLAAKTQKVDWLPETAIVSLGLGKVAFIKSGIGFKAHNVVTGITYKNKVQVLQGLTSRDTVAANAQYLMDSESFIKVKE